MLKTVSEDASSTIKRQMVDPAASKSNTLIDSAVTFYPIHIGQWFLTLITHFCLGQISISQNLTLLFFLSARLNIKQCYL